MTMGLPELDTARDRKVFLLSLTFLSLAFALPEGYPSIPMRGVEGNMSMPLIGCGTWLYNSTTAEASVSTAFGLGYRHVDTAYGYGNQDGVGAALAKSGLARSEYFVTSKVPGGLNASDTTAALELSLTQLGLLHVDLMLLHWPAQAASCGSPAAGRQAQWLALESFAKKGKARAIGISHYCKRHLNDILAVSTLPVALNQVQYHVGMGMETTSELHDHAYMSARGIVYMAYSSLCGPCPNGGNADLLNGPLTSSIGKRYGKTGAQVALKWVVQQGIPVIPKASSAVYLKEDFELFDFELSDDDMWALGNSTSPPQTGTPPQKPDDDQDCDAP